MNYTVRIWTQHGDVVDYDVDALVTPTSAVQKTTKSEFLVFRLSESDVQLFHNLQSPFDSGPSVKQMTKK